ncbi:MAG: hypothetical protein KME25_30445 [Symplocastrum torsivum CPER-KK1]|jgi:hypothetical protein|uniref:Uncharacterized protein n=1 Tax=Symplocastrum torsivum CPER-KK1 TaxID=450513 RepID=A0A951PRQ6_9CYAN|nr:hypothetical protein [Symplocastrum torsivum CPER-KK1]
MGRESNPITLSLESLRLLGSWAADCAERALSVYETYADLDSRPCAATRNVAAEPGVGRLRLNLCIVNKPTAHQIAEPERSLELSDEW